MKKRLLIVAAASMAAAGWTQERDIEPRYAPLAYSEEVWHGSTFWTGPDWTRIGKDWHHPGEETPSVRRFVCPQDGGVKVEGRVFKRHLDGDGIRASVRHNGREVWHAEIGGADGKGREHTLELDVKKGDAIRFTVHKRGGIACDTTGWDPAVVYADGGRHQASEAFAAKKQGAGGWFYEREGASDRPSVAQISQPPPSPAPPAFVERVKTLGEGFSPETEPALLALVAEEWWREDRLDDTGETCRAAADNHLARLRRLGAGTVPLREESETWPDAYIRIRLLKRERLLSDPLLAFGELLVCKRRTTAYAHLVGQYYGWNQRAGGGVYAVRRPGRSLETRDLIAGRLPEGSYLEPRLSYDGARVLFAFVTCGREAPPPASLAVNERGGGDLYFHLFELDPGTPGEKELRQLTEGHYDDLMAEYLPDGGIVFCSTRRKGYSRCFGPQFSKRWDNYTLHRADGDGGNIRTLSYNDVSEWFPSVSHSGEILFARWDYIDRDAVTHQNLWSCRPDGTNPMAVWGNGLPKPHCTFQAKPVPGSRKLVFIASAHHSVTAGPVCLLDPAVGLNAPEAVERITPLPYPEAEGWNLPEWYESPWPLSENLFLAAYSPNRLRNEGQHNRGDRNPDDGLRIVLLDRQGNRELLYRDTRINTTTPIPLTPRPAPPVLASLLPGIPPPHGEMTVYDVYRGLDGVPRGSIAAIRIVQLFPKTTPLVNVPHIGVAGEENARAILGTVPVEADGSARFRLPAKTKVLFQAVDREGFVRRTMRSSTYLQPGESISCVGCHEYASAHTRPQAALPLAMRRAPSEPDPGPLGGRPFGFVEAVQSILDAKCASCHGGKEPKDGVDLSRRPGTRGFTASYESLCYAQDAEGRTIRRLSKLTGRPLVTCYPQRNQIQITPTDSPDSALGSGLIRMFREGHHDVSLTDDEWRRIAAWLDLNAVFYGVYEPEEQLALQREGKPVPIPEIH
jgi:hypothetical protein